MNTKNKKKLNDEDKYYIIFLKKEGYNINEISMRMKLNRKTISKWINRYNNDHNVKRKKGSGIKKNVIDEIDNLLIEEVKNDDMVTVRELEASCNNQNIKIKKSAIHKRLNKIKISYKNPIYKPMLKKNI